MKRRCLFLLFLFAMACATGGAWGQGRWRDLPPDERRQLRQQMREHWEQQHEFRREEGPGRWRDIPPEDRRRIREEKREQRGWSDRHDGPRGGRGWRRD